MPAPATVDEFVQLVVKSEVLEKPRLEQYLEKIRGEQTMPSEPNKLAGMMIRDGLLTYFQAEQFLQGRWKRFSIGRYRVLERLGSGGMGQVFLCEHKVMRRRVAIKVLPTSKAEDTSSLARFEREARAVAALDHPNIVRAYDIDQEDNLHFLVMEYVDGASLQDLVKKFGPMDPIRAAHYMYQSAVGLQHAHDVAGLIHRDIKPGNIMIDRSGTAKILDMGLARFFHDEEDNITRRHDETVLGTADYLAPEQAIDSHIVDIRADIYSLGATMYFMLSGNPPFAEGTVAQKLIWHQNRQPKPLTEYRQDIQPDLLAVLNRMMVKDPDQRYQLPRDVAEALMPWAQLPIDPPSDREMPQLCTAAMGRDGAMSMTNIRRAPASAATMISHATTRGTSPSVADIGPFHPNGGSSTAQSISASPQPGHVQRPNPTPTPQPPRSPAGSVGTDPYQPLWDTIDGETPGPGSHAGRTGNYSSRRQRSLSGSGKRKWIILAVAALLLAGLASLGGYFLFIAEEVVEVDPGVIRVSQRFTEADRTRNRFATLQEALQYSKDGDRILIEDETIHEPPLTLSSSTRKELTIEPATEGMTVLWRMPPGSLISQPLLDVSRVDGLTIRGFKMDGEGRASAIIKIGGTCPGLLLENLHLTGARDALVALESAGGTPERPMVIRRVRFKSGKRCQVGVSMITGRQGTEIHEVDLLDCRIEGPYGKSGVLFDGTVNGVNLDRNRFYSLGDAVLIEYPETSDYYRFELKRNTFGYVANAAIAFTAAPAKGPNVARNDIRITDNLFTETKAIFRAGDANPIPGLKVSGNARTNDTALLLPDDKRMPIPIPAKEVAGRLPLPNPEDDEQFLTYPPNSPFATAGTNDGPVGYGP